MVVGSDRMDHEADSWTRPDSGAHPDVLAAIAAIRAGLRTLLRERRADSTPPPRALRLAEVAPHDPDGIDETVDGLSLLTLGERARAVSLPAVPVILPPQAPDSPLARARAGLGLTAFEGGVLALALAAEVDDRCGHLITLLHADDTLERRRPTVELALALLAPDAPRDPALVNRLVAGAPLYAWGLLRSAGAAATHPVRDADEAHPRWDAVVLRQPLALEAAALLDLHGASPLHPSLAAVAEVSDAGLSPAVSAPALPPALAVLADPSGPTARSSSGTALALLVVGTDAQACLAAAEATAARRGQPLLLVDGDLVAAREDGVGVLRRLLLAAVLRDWLPCVRGAAPLLTPGAPQARAYRRVLRASRRPVLLLGGEDVAAGEGIARVEAPPPRMADRLAQWRRAADAQGIAADDDTLRALAETAGLSGPDIEEAARATVAEAVARRGLARGTDLQRAARLALRARATDLRLVAPRASWADLVLPEDRLRLLRRLCSRVRYRSQVREEWTIGAATLPGVTALFSGAPGTGKSLAAEVIAADLGLDLCKIDLSQTVSKYIGETEKTLGRLFDAAERGGVLLVFDEADALFGKRSAVKDSHDRYANLETSYLLQRLERFSGLAILTSNLGANLDEAFTRRLSMGVDFPLPGPTERLSLWLRALGQAPTGADLNLSWLAERLELSGGEILNVAIGAAYLAAEEGGAIDAARVREALRGELGKMGRLVEPYLARVAAPVAPVAPAAPAVSAAAPPPAASPAPVALAGQAVPSRGTERRGDASRTAEPRAEGAEPRPARVREAGRAGEGDSGGERAPGSVPAGGPGGDSGGHGAMTSPTPPTPAPAAPAPPTPTPTPTPPTPPTPPTSPTSKPAPVFRRGNSYATEGVRGPRPPDKRPGS